VTDPFFADVVTRARSICGLFQQAIAENLKANYLAAEAHSAANLALRAVWQFLGLLADLVEEVAPHPYDFFRALRSLYVDVCLFRQIEPHLAELPYRHNQIARSFSGLLRELDDLLRVPGEATPYVEFVTKEGVRSCVLPPALRRAKDVFLLVQKPHVTTPLSLAGVKLASPSRLDIVHDRALRGIVFDRLDGPPFFHGLSPAVEFYSLLPGQEWDYTVSESAVSFFDADALKDFRFFLYWREQ
jgi:type VI secretion system protein ImpJ